MSLNIDDFLMTCSKSGDAAYGALRNVLQKLEDPKTRVEARVFLTRLQKHFDASNVDPDQCFETYHFRIDDLQLQHSQGFQQRKKLTMLVIPSIFMPEHWSFMFYEGLNRHPESMYKDKTIAELGSGNGWITIAIAQKWSPFKVYGLDINPRAVKISWINLYLNALHDDGQPIYDGEKKTLLDRVEFHESDLLSHCKDNNIMLERIVGCIPQGFVEDQFGLGLIARAVEEGIVVIKPAGIMIFIMGDRPGQAVCKRLFERRGFHVYKIWQRKIVLPADTNISALVEIVKNSPHRFEFFMGLTGDQPICARTAWAYGNVGGCISHSISVYSCQLRQPTQVKTIFEFLRDGFQDISNSLDLFFEDDAVADEKIPFLAYLASVLQEKSFHLFEQPAGSRRFRDLVAGFMKAYHHVPLTSKNVVIFPSRATAIENALRLFSPKLAIVDEHLTKHLPRKWMTSLVVENTDTCEIPEDVVTVIEAPRQSDLMVELIKKLKPQVVVTGLASFEAITNAAFEKLLEVTREIGSRLFLDISDHFELSSLPSSIGVLKYLAGNSLPSHAAIICGLLKNQVYKDLEVAFLVSEDETIFQALARTVELLEGNTALISQNYYGCLFNELLSFQLPDRHPLVMRQCQKKEFTNMIGFASSAISVFNDAELSISEADSQYSLIHMDIDQSFLPLPSPVKAAIFESFVRQNLSESETDATSSIRQFITTRYGFPTNNNTEFLYSDYSLGLFNKLLLSCFQEGGSFCFPAGCNGNYIAAAKFMNVNILNIPSTAETSFKLTDDALIMALESVEKPWVYISGPTSNPTGLVYSNKEMENILAICAKYGARVLIDTSFSGLEYDTANENAWNLGPILANIYCSASSRFCVSLLGGLSLGMLTGWLTFGFLVVDQSLFAQTPNGFAGLSPPHITTRYAMKKLLAQAEQEASDISKSIAEHKGILKNRSQRLKKTLEKYGWEVLPSHGGVSLAATPSEYLGKRVNLEGAAPQEIEASNSTIREILLKATGLCLNSDSWTGIPGYCRFTIALQDDEFEQALVRITKLKEVINY